MDHNDKHIIIYSNNTHNAQLIIHFITALIPIFKHKYKI